MDNPYDSDSGNDNDSKKDNVKDNKETIKGIYEFFNLEGKDLPRATVTNKVEEKLQIRKVVSNSLTPYTK
jgi:hypothetical protein